MKKADASAKQLGARLKNFRLRAGFSAEEVSRKVGVASTTYREWENGRAISGEPYEKLARVLGVTVYQLLGIQEINLHEIANELEKIEKLIQNLKSRL